MPAILVFASVPLFLGALLSNVAYSNSYEIQWLNFAAWLIPAGMLMAGLALLWAAVDALRPHAARQRPGLIDVGLLLATFVLGFINALMHGMDGWAVMPTGLILSALVVMLAIGASVYGLARLFAIQSMRTRGLRIAVVVAAVVMLSPWTIIAAVQGGSSNGQQGANPELPPPQRGLLPNMGIAEPAGWGERRPSVPPGWTIQAIATDLKVPRQTLALPNGDILVAEGRGGGAPVLRPKDYIAGIIKSKGTTAVKSGNQLTLLRDADGDGTYEGRWVYAKNLNAPYGLALMGNSLYVAKQDSLVRFEYDAGQTQASAPPVTVARLPAAINHHWTKSLVADADGRHLYVGIGSNSNIGERGMAVEENRAVVWQVDASTGATRPFATGLRNPTALAIEPASRQLWAVVNERDELGPDLVPDYLTSVHEGAFYGWPYAYWGPNVDRRVQPQNDELVKATVRPDFALQSHSAPLGLSFVQTGAIAPFTEGAFIGLHGSWNRDVPVGYKVVFVPFANSRPAGPAVDFVTGFQADGKTMGRPVGVTVDPKGAVIVADDLSNTNWRVMPVR